MLGLKLYRVSKRGPRWQQGIACAKVNYSLVEVLWYLPMSNFMASAQTTILYNGFEYHTFDITATSPMGKWFEHLTSQIVSQIAQKASVGEKACMEMYSHGAEHPFSKCSELLLITCPFITCIHGYRKAFQSWSISNQSHWLIHIIAAVYVLSTDSVTAMCLWKNKVVHMVHSV